MNPVLLAMAVILTGGLAALAAYAWPRLASWLATLGCAAGAALGLVPAVQVVFGRLDAESIRYAWTLPLGECHLALDALSAFFLIPILLLAALAAVYGTRYLDHDGGPRVAVSWFFYTLLAAGMVLVVVARDGMLFLLAWEMMSLASFFLVAYDDRRDSVRRAAWTYLVATHVGTAALLALFIVLSGQAGSLDFDDFAKTGLTPDIAALAFVLALVGFGTKAGFVPLHVWLPEAHPAAPSHVSAVMSGVMIKTGLYGLIRTLTLIGPPAEWWGWVLVGIGLTSGIFGVLFALAQGDLKRVLAYSSVENIGIVALGLGLGLIGLACDAPAAALLGFAGALVHIINHALFKGLLFLGAGSVLHAAGTVQLDRLGGLLKRMPKSAGLFLIAAAAICGLPPLNGFLGEFLVFLGALRGVLSSDLSTGVMGATVIGGLGLISGLAVACFTRAFGLTFLGEPRSNEANHAHEAAWPMLLPMALLAAACLAVGLAGPWFLGSLLPETLRVTCPAAIGAAARLDDLFAPLQGVVTVVVLLLALIATLTLVRRVLLRGRPIGEAGTWDCGYLRPTARMEYTASSFAQPLAALFRTVLRTRRSATAITDEFPRGAKLETQTGDLFADRLIDPAFRRVREALSRLRWIQHGQVRLYVLYIALTLLALLIWKLT